MRGIHRWQVNSPHNGSVTRKLFPFGDVIMFEMPNKYHRCWIDTTMRLLCSHLWNYVCFELKKQSLTIHATCFNVITSHYVASILAAQLLSYVQIVREIHYGDVIMVAMASQITSLTIAYSTLKLRVTGLCVGNSPVTGEFPALMASNTENDSIWWCHRDATRVTLIQNRCPLC